MWFLQLLGVIALLVLVGLLYGLWRLRRWWKRSMSQAMQLQRDLDPLLNWPARLNLSRTTVDPDEDGLALPWPHWVEAGFERLGDYTAADGALSLLRLAQHPSGVTLCLALDPLQKPVATVFAVAVDGSFHALSEAPGRDARTPKLHWEPSKGGPPADLVRALTQRLEAVGLAPRRLDARLATAAIERAYAVWMDQQLSQPPSAESVRARLSAAGTAVDEAALEESLKLHRQRWREQLATAALDRWRQSARPDVETWTRIEHQIEVLPESISDQEVAELLAGEELADQLLAQTEAQGLRGIRQYAAVVERLSLGQRRKLLATLQHPVPLRLYVLDSADQDEAAESTPRSYVYRDPQDGAAGTVLAASVADAREQLRAMGHADAEILIEPNALSGTLDRQLWTPEAAELAARSATEPLHRALLRSFAANLWLWLPPLILLGWAFEGRPDFGLWQGLAVLYAVLSYAALIWLVLPMVLYHQVQACKASARLASAKNLMTVLRLLRPLGITGAQIQRELASIEMAMGRTEASLARLQPLKSSLDEAGWQETLAVVLGSSDDHNALIAAQTRAMTLAQDPGLLRIDLALSLLRYRRDVQAAEPLLNQAAPGSLSATALAGYHYARGLLLAERGQSTAALRQYRSAIDSLAAFRSNPMIGPLSAEIEAFAALALRAEGRQDEACTLWNSVWPLLSRHRSTRYLEGRWAG